MFASYPTWGGQFTAAPGIVPLTTPPPVYTNETSTAQSRPIAPAVAYTREGILPSVDSSGTFVNTVGWVPTKTIAQPTPTPTNPASPRPTYPQDPAQQVKKTSPWLWAGIAATGLFLFFVVKRYA